MSEPKQRKKRMPMSDMAKAIMTAKRRATIAAKKNTTTLVQQEERRRVFSLLIDIDEFRYSGNVGLEKWLITQIGVSKEQAISYVEEYLRNKQQLKRQYEVKSINVHDFTELSAQLTAFYKACPKYSGSVTS